MIFGCTNAEVAEACRSRVVGVVSLACSGHLPPAFIDYVISRKLADGVIISGCAENSCLNRRGGAWTTDRVERRRDPRLRNRIPKERVKVIWAGRRGLKGLRREIEAFAVSLEALGPYRPVRGAKIAAHEPGRANA
jgi:coenzyme F420-reducing hydrogenase delta subunit